MLTRCKNWSKCGCLWMYCVVAIKLYVIIFDHPQSGVVYNFARVCMSVCLSDNNFWKPWRRKFIFPLAAYLHSLRVMFVYESPKSLGQDQGRRSQKGWKFLFSQCKTSIGNNSCSIKHRAVMFACSMGFLSTADRMMWPPSYVTWPEMNTRN